MTREIQSKALEANLAETRSLEFAIPEEHQWLLSLTTSTWGIHQRAREFITEFNHPYSNRKEVIELLSQVAISDFWVYRQRDECGRVLDLFLDLFAALLRERLSDELSRRLVFLFLHFFSKNRDAAAESEPLTRRFIAILDAHLDDHLFGYISNLGYFSKSLDAAAAEATGPAVFAFMVRLIEKNILFWRDTADIEAWYRANRRIMSRDYLPALKPLGRGFFDACLRDLKQARSWKDLAKNSFAFPHIIDSFRQATDLFVRATEQFSYILYLIHLPGMVYHRDYLLIDLNNAIKRIGQELSEDQAIQAIDELFGLFSELKHDNTSLILDSILTLGKEIINTHNRRLIHHFEDRVIRFGFVSPGASGLTDEWALKVNPNHVKNIRVWLELIEHDPETMKNLLSALIINLRVGGIFIFDTDLFQKDVTRLLNATVSPIYKQIKQLTRIFPVYFNEIGAEGRLRDVTTRLDEITRRNDKLIHFLRKQVHTEGNNSHIHLTAEIIRFWADPDPERLRDLVPRNVLEVVDPAGPWVQGVHDVLVGLLAAGSVSVDEWLAQPPKERARSLAKTEQGGGSDALRVALIVELYQLLKEKYFFETDDVGQILRRHAFIAADDITGLEAALAERRSEDALKRVYGIMGKLNAILFDPAPSEGWENIYYKRHVAFGIPSMYGEYREPKFEALGLTFRLERIAAVLVQDIIAKINTDYFSAKTLKDVYAVIQLLQEGLSLDGIYDQGFDSNLKMFLYSLTSGSFTIRQYINIFQFMENSVKEIINKFFIRPYDRLLSVIIPQYAPAADAGGVADQQGRQVVCQKSEIFYRELLSSAFLIQTLDQFIGEVLNNLRRFAGNLSDAEIQNIMTYDPDLVISPLYEGTPAMDNQVFLGSKAYYLKKLYLNRFPVPPGFVITTEVFRRMHAILKIPSLNAEIDALIRRHISELERISGLRFGDPRRPLLLSVRSGAAISMPGAMNTFLNVGLNDEITEELSRQPNFGWTSWDCYRRLLQTWGMAYGLDRNQFDQIMVDFKRTCNVPRKIDFPPPVMREIAFAYQRLLRDHGIQFAGDPFLQIKEAIISVFNSWDTPRAQFYRNHMQIAPEWGTAVIVQQMIFGNLHNESGSGVLFTHDVNDDVPGINLAGDFTFLSQGEDIVAGLVNTLPISENQRRKYYRKSPFSLETAFPRIYDRLRQIANELIEVHGFGHQEIEFTFEKAEPEDLYVLQTRDMVIVKQNEIETFATPEKKRKRVGCGIGIGNRVLNGAVVFDREDLAALRRRSPEQKAVLVRPDTVPEDIEMIIECEGLLTSKGGATSHAAVTAATLGKIGVVNCDDMLVFEGDKRCVINGTVFSACDPIAIDGHKGIVYQGNYPIKIQAL